MPEITFLAATIILTLTEKSPVATMTIFIPIKPTMVPILVDDSNAASD